MSEMPKIERGGVSLRDAGDTTDANGRAPLLFRLSVQHGDFEDGDMAGTFSVGTNGTILVTLEDGDGNPDLVAGKFCVTVADVVQAAVQEYRLRREEMEWTGFTTTTYTYLEDGVQRWGDWDGTREDAFHAGVAALPHALVDKDDRSVQYFAEEVGDDVTVSCEAVIHLGAALLSGVKMNDVYSVWCADYAS